MAEARIGSRLGSNSTKFNWNLWARNALCGSSCPTLIGVVDPSGAYAITYLGVQGASIANAFAQHAPIKLVLLLREPIQRAFSAYRMGQERDFRYEFRYASFDKLVKAEVPRLASLPPVWSGNARENLRLGMYGEQLDALARAGFVFPGARLCILISERILANATREYSRLWAFLGASHATTHSHFDFVANWSSTNNLSAFAAVHLYRAYYNSTSHVYAVLGGVVKEWAAWYNSHQLSLTAQPANTQLKQASAALAHGRTVRYVDRAERAGGHDGGCGGRVGA